MKNPLQIMIGHSAEHVSLTFTGRTHPSCTDYWDGNWLSTIIEVATGGFRGRVTADLRAEELETFRDQLKLLYEKNSGVAML